MKRSRTACDGIVIVGGGLAGQRCAETLRRLGYDGRIRVVCAERHRPYDRPPLSKKLLTAPHEAQPVAYRPASWYGEQSVELLPGVRATSLRPAERRVEVSDGSVLSYLRLLIATGSKPRSVPLLEGYDNVSTLRTIDDARRLRVSLSGQPRVAVIGAGFIGQEVAASARSVGAAVTMVEAAPCPLVGILGPEIGAWFAGLHRSEGVEVLTGCTVERVLGNGAVRGLRLSDGRTVATDHVVVGVGVEPDVGWLAGSGLGARAGVPVDSHGRSGAPGVLAAGDAAATFDRVSGRHVPGSHWEAASRQGARAGRVMLGLEPGPASPTSFWTDQYGIRIQYLGHARLADSVRIDGEPDQRDFTATFLRAGRAVAALLVNRPRALPAARTLIEKGTT